MIRHGHGTVGFISTCLSLVAAISTCIVSLVIVLMIGYHLYRHHYRLKREDKISFLLFFYIYLSMLNFTLVTISMNIQTLIGDIYGNKFYSPWCVFRGYWFFVAVFTSYYGFVVQTLFRLFRIAYWHYAWLQSVWIFVISTPLLIIIGSIMLSPILVWQDLIYLPKEHYCQIQSTDRLGMIWVILVCYMIPFTGVLIIYIRITVFLRQQSNNLAVTVQRRQQRDLVVIRHILINIGTLVVGGMPSLVINLVTLFSGVEQPLTKRISIMTIEMTAMVLSIEIVFMTPQLKRLVMNRGQQNQLSPNQGMIQMRLIATHQ